MKMTLLLNAGSSSVKYAVARNRTIIARGFVDHFGRDAEIVRIEHHRRRVQKASVPNLQAALVIIRRIVTKLGVKPDVVAHRIVHGGEKFSQPTRLSPSAIRSLRGLAELAPLHQQANLAGVAFALRVWPRAAAWGVFDTAIYRSLPEVVRTYAVPRALAKRLGIVRYGFHGTSHAWAFRQGAKKLGKSTGKLSAATIHLGAGASMTLWCNGKPINTTMGFTPLEGLVMSTRSGSIDPAIPLFLQDRLGWSTARIKHLLEEESGLKGLCGLSDMRDVLGAAGHPVPRWPRGHWSPIVRMRARLALDIFIHHLQNTLSGYLGMLEKKDAVIFTGPVGENRFIQRLVLQNLPTARGVPHLTIHADEEQAILDAIRL